MEKEFRVDEAKSSTRRQFLAAGSRLHSPGRLSMA
jgi:hypothetical protein